MTTDVVNAAGKWLGTFLGLGAIFALVWVGKADPQVFIAMIGTALGGGVYHVASRANSGTGNGGDAVPSSPATK